MADVTVVGALKMSRETDKLFEALAKAQAKMQTVEKSNQVKMELRNGGRVQYNYAELSDVQAAVTDAFKDEGLSYAQPLGRHNDKEMMTTIVMHSSGQWLASEMPLPPFFKTFTDHKTGELKTNPMTPQEIGSLITYFRRYCLASAVGVAQSDDDGNAANGNTVQEIAPKPQQTQAKAVLPPEPPNMAPKVDKYPGGLTEPQVKRLYAIAKSKDWTLQDLNKVLAEGYQTDVKNLKKFDYDELCKAIESGSSVKQLLNVKRGLPPGPKDDPPKLNTSEEIPF